MKNPNSLEDITFELKQMGMIVGKSLEAQLLAQFIEAAMIAIDNRLALLTAQHEAAGTIPPRLLFLNYHHNYSIPTQKTLNGQLIARLGSRDISLEFAHENDKSNEWMISVSKEKIVNLQPDCLVVITENPDLVKNEILNDQALSQLPAVKNNRLCFLNEAIQHSPSQYIVLAYYDLAQTLINLP
jgi:iron complex transport system substrate-binding protein